MNRIDYERSGVRDVPVRCRCGWSAAAPPTKREARLAYQEHLASSEWICRCGERDPAKRAASRDSAKCKTCLTRHVQRWKAANKQAWERLYRDAHLRSHYGITSADYTAMLERQGGRCAICRTRPEDSPRKFHVDHDHATGRVRGILCFKCNAGLGSFDDDTERMERAAAYLR